jgi:fructose-specific phosphotransferase system IIC component
MHSHGYDLGLLFFGFSNLILGCLVIKSDYFPGILGYGLIAAALVYLTGSLTVFLFPDYISLIKPIYIVPLVAELSFCLWLLVKGVRDRP